MSLSKSHEEGNQTRPAKKSHSTPLTKNAGDMPLFFDHMIRVGLTLLFLALIGTASPRLDVRYLTYLPPQAPQVLAEARGKDCQGTVGSFSYSLKPLAYQLKGRVVSANDSDGNTYYYLPCSPLASSSRVVKAQQCARKTLGKVVFETPTRFNCYELLRKIPQYHNLGSTNGVTWSVRNSGPDTIKHITEQPYLTS